MIEGFVMKALVANLCNNILERGNKENIGISPMKLQRLLYFVCRDYVRRTGQKPISEDFEVCQYGPVIPSVYGMFRFFGASPIRGYAQDAFGKSYKVSERDNPVLASSLDTVWAKYKRLNGIELSQKTHQKGSGWYRAYMDGRDKISLEDIKNDTTE